MFDDPAKSYVQGTREENDEFVRKAMSLTGEGHPDVEFAVPAAPRQTADDLHRRLTQFLNALDAEEGQSHAWKLQRLVSLEGHFQTLFREAITHQAEAIEHEAKSP
jgi:hypothetical protein